MVRQVLLQQANQLDLFGQKGVVAVSARHLSVVDINASRADRLRKGAHGGRQETASPN